MKRVLIVDDAAFVRNTIKKVLENNDFQVVGEASNGVEAVNRYQELKPDVVIMDITMPKMSGVEALKLIMKMDPKAKVVMLTALGQESLVKESIFSGAKSFIVKPYNDDHVIFTLRKILNIQVEQQ